ncbi:MAG: hypothetical protein RIE16_16740 [Rhodospirillales bacterium]
MKNTIMLKDAPARGSGPRWPIMAVSVVSMATQAIWVATMGAARRNSCASSLRQTAERRGRFAGVWGARAVMVVKSVVGFQIGKLRTKKADPKVRPKRGHSMKGPR